MVREDLIAGLKNAIERGYSIDQAKHSFITAGYNREDIEEAVQFVQGNSIISPEKKEMKMPSPAMAIQPSKTIKPVKELKPSVTQQPKVPSRINWKVIILIVILAILVVVFILTLLLKDKLLAWFA